MVNTLFGAAFIAFQNWKLYESTRKAASFAVIFG
jgi:hypothetical protein